MSKPTTIRTTLIHLLLRTLRNSWALLAWLSLMGVARPQNGDDFPEIRNSKSEESLFPMPAEQAVKELQLPAGFKATVFAKEPDVQNPIAMAWDTRDRLWIAENFTYSERAQRFDLSHRDRVLVFEDRDGDGQADSRTVFCDNVQMLTSVEVGLGGVWLMCPPQLLFVPDENNDAIPDGPARVVLNGFDVAQDNYHNFANGLRFGPDGWLYGRCGHSCPGKIGLPGTAMDKRVPLDGGIWRYHPQKKTVEVLCHGTTNPWGHDWDEHGELFFINTVIGHLWHMVPGCHFKESFGESQNPRVYQRMDMIADHYHFDRKGNWTESRDGKANDLGGGHAHIGAMIYLGKQWPDSYHNRLFTLNMHGRRTNVERLERSGTGYVGKHEPDVFLMSDPFFRGIDLTIGPDGNCYVIDWSDTGECHEHNGVHRRSGRIYRISYGKQATHQPLVKPWCAAGTGRLPKLWSDYREGKVTTDHLHELLEDPDEHLRVWAIRLLTDFWPLDYVQGPSSTAIYPNEPLTVSKLVKMAEVDQSGLVRRQLASTLQRLPVAERIKLASALSSRVEDIDDVDMNLLVWFGISPTGDKDPGQLVSLAVNCKWPMLTASIARYISSGSPKDATALNQLIEAGCAMTAVKQASLLTGLSEGFHGWRKSTKPASWEKFTASFEKGSPEVREQVLKLSALFGDGLALDHIRAIAMDSKAANRDRQQALETLIESRPADLRKVCESLLDTRVVNATAAKGLAVFDDPAIAKLLVQKFKRFQPDDRALVMEILASRPSFAEVMLDELAGGKSPITRDDIKATHARQMRNFGDKRLNDKVASAWGTINDSPAEKAAEIERWKGLLNNASLATANLPAGRALYDKTCSQCHKLFGAGKAIGPELTGAQRSSLDYLLGNILDPSAVVGKEYRMSIVLLDDGRTISGLITNRDDKKVSIRTATDEVTVETESIETIKESNVSAMPDGLLQNLSEQQVRDLIAYLMSPVQID